MREHHQLYFIALWNPYCLLRQFQRGIKATEFIDEAEVLGILSGPDAALGNLQNFVLGQLAAVRDFAGEVDVNPVEPVLETLPLGRRIVLGARPHSRVGAVVDLVPREADLVPKP